MIKIINKDGAKQFLCELAARNEDNNLNAEAIVKQIIQNVKTNKDMAVKDYCCKFDGVSMEMMESLEVSQEEISEVIKALDPKLLESLEKSRDNIWDYHKRQFRESNIYSNEDDTITLGQLIRPIDKVGIYIPGGKASYPSTVLMNCIPAKIAGVREIIMVTPPDKDGKVDEKILAAAKIAGVDRIFKVGGAQAIAALAYGTETIPKVDKITGPGNIYVAIAKKMVSQIVGIDMIAGPSEVLVIADENANPVYAAADMLSQAEHDEMAAAVLLTNSQRFAEKMQKEIDLQLERLERKQIASLSIESNSAIVVMENINECIEIANAVAPEHLELLVRNPFEIYKQIRNAGAIFLGEYTPEPVGDYFAGPNHTLPTSQTARFSSPLSVDDFIKKTSLIYYSKEALRTAKEDIIRIAECEGLTAHANSIKVREF